MKRILTIITLLIITVQFAFAQVSNLKCVVVDSIYFENTTYLNEFKSSIHNLTLHTSDSFVLVVPRISEWRGSGALRSCPLYLDTRENLVKQVRFKHAPKRFNNTKRPWYAFGMLALPYQDVLFWYNTKEILITNRDFNYLGALKITSKVFESIMFTPWITGKTELMIPIDRYGAPVDSTRFMTIPHKDIMHGIRKKEWKTKLNNGLERFSSDSIFSLHNRMYASAPTKDIVFYHASDGLNLIEYNHSSKTTQRLAFEIPYFNEYTVRATTKVPVGFCQMEDVQVYSEEEMVGGIKHDALICNPDGDRWVLTSKILPKNEKFKAFLNSQLVYNSKPNDEKKEYYVCQYFGHNARHVLFVTDFHPNIIAAQDGKIDVLQYQTVGDALKMLKLRVTW
jgi:hypothetical protein